MNLDHIQPHLSSFMFIFISQETRLHEHISVSVSRFELFSIIMDSRKHNPKWKSESCFKSVCYCFLTIYTRLEINTQSNYPSLVNIDRIHNNIKQNDANSKEIHMQLVTTNWSDIIYFKNNISDNCQNHYNQQFIYAFHRNQEKHLQVLCSRTLSGALQ